jgi:hypothetical protein
MCDIVGMDKRKLQKIIDVNADAAEMGCATSQSLIVLAQSELDEIANLERLEWWAMLNRQEQEIEEMSI